MSANTNVVIVCLSWRHVIAHQLKSDGCFADGNTIDPTKSNNRGTSNKCLWQSWKLICWRNQVGRCLIICWRTLLNRNSVNWIWKTSFGSYVQCKLAENRKANNVHIEKVMNDPIEVSGERERALNGLDDVYTIWKDPFMHLLPSLIFPGIIITLVAALISLKLCGLASPGIRTTCMARAVGLSFSNMFACLLLKIKSIFSHTQPSRCKCHWNMHFN